MKLQSLLFLSFFALYACKKEVEIQTKSQPAGHSKSVAKDTEKSDSLTPQAFPFPDEIAGCSCYFGENRHEFVIQNYIYADDFQKTAFLKINGKMVKFDLTEKDQQTPGDSIKISFKNKDYTVEVKGELIEKGEIETALYKGKIHVSDRNGKKASRDFYGECGC